MIGLVPPILLALKGASLGPAPVITSVTGPSGSGDAVFDPAGGGLALRVNGTGFVSGCTCTIGGVAASVAFVSATRIDVTPGATTSGVKNVVVTNPDLQTSGTSGNGLAEAFKPHDLSPTLELLPGAYSSSTGIWTDASGGARHATYQSATKPGSVLANGTGTEVPDFVAASSHWLRIPNSLASGTGSPPDMATLSAGTMIMAFEADAQPTPDAGYADAVLMVGDAASAGLVYNSNGATWEAYDETALIYRRPTTTAAATGVKHFTCGRWNGTTWSHRLNGGSFANVTNSAGVLSNGNVGANTELGRSFAGGQYYDGREIFALVYASAISDANVTKIYRWAQQRGFVA